MHFPEVPFSDPFIKIFPATFLTLKLWLRLDRIVGALFLMIPLSSDVDIFPGAAQILKLAHKLGALMGRKVPPEISFSGVSFLALATGELSLVGIMSSADVGGQSLFIHIIFVAGGALVICDTYVLLLDMEPHSRCIGVGLPTNLAVQIICIYVLKNVFDILLLVGLAGINTKPQN